jgi:hypothetical protein
MSIYSNIRVALESNVTNVTGVPSSGNISWENVRFEPTTGSKWIRSTFRPTRRRPLDVTAKGLQRYDGLFLVDIFIPEGGGPSEADTLADNVVNSFEAGTILTANGQEVMIEHAEISEALNEDSPWYQVPVTIKWKAFN